MCQVSCLMVDKVNLIYYLKSIEIMRNSCLPFLSSVSPFPFLLSFVSFSFRLKSIENMMNSSLTFSFALSLFWTWLVSNNIYLWGCWLSRIFLEFVKDQNLSSILKWRLSLCEELWSSKLNLQISKWINQQIHLWMRKIND